MTRPFEQSPGTQESPVHPFSEIQLSPNEVGTVMSAMNAINNRRAESGIQHLEERFAGILPTEAGKQLVVVDEMPLGPSRARYFVRTTLLDNFRVGGAVPEEAIDYTQRYRDGGKQVDLDSSTGMISLVRHPAVTPFEQRRAAGREVTSLFQIREVVFPPSVQSSFDKLRYLESLGRPADAAEKDAIYHGDPVMRSTQAAHLADIFAPVIHEDKVKIARDTLRAETPDGASFHVHHVYDALGSERLDDVDRARLLGVGRNIVRIFQDSPESITRDRRSGRYRVVDPEMARAMAHAENQVRQTLPEEKPLAGFVRRPGHKQRTNARDFAMWDAHTTAENEYKASLSRPGNALPPKPSTDRDPGAGRISGTL